MDGFTVLEDRQACKISDLEEILCLSLIQGSSGERQPCVLSNAAYFF